MRFLVGLALLGVTLCCPAQERDLTCHRDRLRSQFDTSHWRRFWTDDTWHVRCIFSDADNDGIEELIACTTSDEDRMGDVWKLWKADSRDKMSLVVNVDKVGLVCPVESFFRISYEDGSGELIVLNTTADSGESTGVAANVTDCVLTVLTPATFDLHAILPSFDALFSSNGVQSVERLYPEWYLGFDFALPGNAPHDPKTMRPPYKQPVGPLEYGGGLAEPENFGLFISEFRAGKKSVSDRGDNRISVYAVLLDVDNDGDSDAYVTSDADCLGNGQYVWQLYKQSENRMVKAEQTVYPVPGRKDICAMPAVARTEKTSFCRIVRLDSKPIFMIINGTSKNQVRNAITDYHAHRVEKLECREYREVSKSRAEINSYEDLIAATSAACRSPSTFASSDFTNSVARFASTHTGVVERCAADLSEALAIFYMLDHDENEIGNETSYNRCVNLLTNIVARTDLNADSWIRYAAVFQHAGTLNYGSDRKASLIVSTNALAQIAVHPPNVAVTNFWNDMVTMTGCDPLTIRDAFLMNAAFVSADLGKWDDVTSFTNQLPATAVRFFEREVR